jgi:hypothetical protein
MSLLRRHLLLATAVCVVAAALCLYWPIRQFPLTFDDLLHIRLVKGVNYLTVWLPNTGFGFYRPVLLLPVLLTRTLFGYYPPAFMYGLNLLLHAGNTALLAALAWRLWQSWSRTLAAGLLFACYPFSFQAVAIFGNNVYLVLLALILLGLHAYLLALEQGGWWWLATAVLFFFGLLTHELMVLFGPFAALIQWAYTGHIEIKRWPWRHPLLIFKQSPYLFFVVAGIVYIAIYQFLPLTGPPASADLIQPEIYYFIQTIIYPLAWLGARLRPNATSLTIGLGLLVWICWTTLAARRPSDRLSLLLGWGWWGITAVLLISTLSTSYILHGARLHYVGSVGVCLLWAVLLDGLWVWRRAGRLLWAAVLTFMLVIGTLFVRGRLTALAQLGTPVGAIQAEMAARPLTEGVLLVNLPAWTAPAQNSFPVGVEHVAVMGEHIFAEELVWENLNQHRPVRAVAVPELLSEVSYPYGIHAQSPDLGDPAIWAAAGASVFISRFTETGVATTFSGRFFPATIAHTAATPLAAWGETWLPGATAVACGELITADLTWQLAPSIPATTSIFVQAVAADGRLLGQADGPPLQLRPDWLTLPANWQITDHRLIQTDGTAPPAALLIGLYDYVSGERTPGIDAAGQPLADHALRLPIQTCHAIQQK